MLTGSGRQASARAGSVAEGASRHHPGGWPDQYRLVPGVCERSAGEIGLLNKCLVGTPPIGDGADRGCALDRPAEGILE